MNDILRWLSNNAVDILVYSAIAFVTLIGFFKCVFPVRRITRSFYSAIRRIERGYSMNNSSGIPAWQSSDFLGKKLEAPWNKFLSNAKQLDARGLTCNVDDYINEDTVIFSTGHIQLSEVIPGLLTSLGILGTFIGLVNGLGGLDLTAGNDKLVNSISNMVNGMTFAFSTSIAGVACSLVFNILCKVSTGSAVKALEHFQDTFSGIVMQRPVDDSVRLIIQQEDQTVMIRHGMSDISERVSEGIVEAVGDSLAPVVSSMSQFINGQTQSQLQGLDMIVGSFVERMNEMLGVQMLDLGNTMNSIADGQRINLEAMNQTIGNTATLMNNLKSMQALTEKAGVSLTNLIESAQKNTDQNDLFLRHSSEVLSGMMAASQEQSDLLSTLESSQQAIGKSMKDYADWSGRVLNAVMSQREEAEKISLGLRNGMTEAAEELRKAYGDFVNSIALGAGKAFGMFEKNISGMISLLSDQVERIEEISRYQPNGDGIGEKRLADIDHSIRELTAEVRRHPCFASGKDASNE